MKNNQKEAGSVVKIDKSLLKDVDNFIKEGDNHFRFSNKKQFIDRAVYEFLKKEKEIDDKK
ncbi:hypothetical protein GOV14_04385 [Candidatus Pacearchaeota archaeon]|nr:hypothetical protein [Candidatus Pacearchaeota archaeon]